MGLTIALFLMNVAIGLLAIMLGKRWNMVSMVILGYVIILIRMCPFIVALGR
jgi:hypothetical protein